MWEKGIGRTRTTGRDKSIQFSPQTRRKENIWGLRGRPNIKMDSSCYWLLLRGVIAQAFLALRPFSDLLCVPIRVLIIPDSSTRALWKIAVETPSIETGNNFARSVL
jgi:hypothetical protein